MKKILVSIFTLIVCENTFAQKFEPFKLPTDSTDSDVVLFKKNFNKGYELYKIGCAACHTTYVNGKETIPDFSPYQLLDYEIRIWPQHTEKIPETTITEVELENILLFLRYKAPNSTIK